MNWNKTWFWIECVFLILSEKIQRMNWEVVYLYFLSQTVHMRRHYYEKKIAYWFHTNFHKLLQQTSGVLFLIELFKCNLLLLIILCIKHLINKDYNSIYFKKYLIREEQCYWTFKTECFLNKENITNYLLNIP